MDQQDSQTTEENVDVQDQNIDEQEQANVPDANEIENDIQSEINEYKEKNRRLAREYEQLRSEYEKVSSNKTSNDPEIPADTNEFLNKFVKSPKEILDQAIESAIKPYQERLMENEKQQAFNYILSQKDYYDGMEDDLTETIIDNRNVYYNYGDQRVKLNDLPPLDKARAAMQILREKKKVAPQKTKQIQPTKVASSKKAGSGTPSKPVTEMSASEIREKLIQMGASVADF